MTANHVENTWGHVGKIPWESNDVTWFRADELGIKSR